MYFVFFMRTNVIVNVFKIRIQVKEKRKIIRFYDVNAGKAIKKLHAGSHGLSKPMANSGVLLVRMMCGSIDNRHAPPMLVSSTPFFSAQHTIQFHRNERKVAELFAIAPNQLN